ncbi:MAG TPA: 16S rRNA (cytosine(967)-C(5))-methyltransferase RsmB [bacterium]|nr:16S rRNA (cytosine(967)-C(5))-methyltransferase RsmB [bacterium]HPN32978.1 16S rRNA (cytosine(967)-C(5))-methyltransferase RsmB [bacterium]
MNSARRLAWEILCRVETQGAFADLLIRQTLDRSPLSAEDRALLNELVRGVMRWKLRLYWIIDQLRQTNAKKLETPLRMVLALGLYQIIYLDRIPEFAAVDESVTLARLVGNAKWASLTNGLLRGYLRQSDKISFPDPLAEPERYISVVYSHPLWLVKIWVRQFGFDQTELLCQADNQPAPLSLRVNILLISSQQFAQELTQRGIAFQQSIVPDFFTFHDLPHSLQIDFLNKGWVTVQDESAGLPNLLFRGQAGQILLDLCAAPGGKSGHMAERSGDRCRVIAMDLQAGRTRLIRSLVSRLGLRSVQVVQADALRPPLRSADVVLLDAPCSGLGVLRRKPDLRWRRRPADIAELVVLQKKLLHQAAELVAKNGVLVYSTCTIHPPENQEMIAWFLHSHPGWALLRAEKTEAPRACVSADGFVETWPHRHGMDGSFAAKLQKL